MTTIRKPTRTSKRPPARAGGWKVLRDTSRIRWSRIQAAQARIASAYYERDEVQAVVIEAILRDLTRR